MNKRITLHDIAAHSGVCRTTVYKFLNNKGKVSPKVQERILNSMDQLGYQKNFFAASLASNKTNRIAFVGFDDSDLYFSAPLLKGMQEAAVLFQDFGIQLDMYLSPITDEKAHLSLIREVSLNPDICGVILFTKLRDAASPYIAKLKADGKFVITVNRDCPNSNRDFYIGCDYLQSGRLGGEVLARMTTQPGSAIVITGNYFQKSILSEEDLLREQGFSSALGMYAPDLKQINLDLSQCGNRFSEILEHLFKSQQVVALGGTSDYEINDVQLAVQRAGINRPKMIFYDLYDQSILALQKGQIDAIISQDFYHQGYIAVKQIFNQINQITKTEDDSRFLRLEVIYQENLKYYQPIHSS